MRRAAAMASLMLAGCAGTSGERPAAPSSQTVACKDDGLEAYIGRKASAELGVQLLARTGARALRWAPPRSAMTMDFRPDRMTVSYDDDMVVISARCG